MQRLESRAQQCIDCNGVYFEFKKLKYYTGKFFIFYKSCFKTYGPHCVRMYAYMYVYTHTA